MGHEYKIIFSEAQNSTIDAAIERCAVPHPQFSFYRHQTTGTTIDFTIREIERKRSAGTVDGIIEFTPKFIYVCFHTGHREHRDALLAHISAVLNESGVLHTIEEL